MSKLLKNYPDPKSIIQKYGGDALRLYFMESVVMLGENIDVNEKEIQNKLQSVLLPLYNCYKYLITYANLHHWSPSPKNTSSDHLLDRWILTKTDKLTKDVAKELENYNIPLATRTIQPYVEDLSRWFIRQSRDRFVGGDQNALQTLWQALIQFAQTVAPIIPFISEQLWQDLYLPFFPKAEQSIHLSNYPQPKKISQSLLSQMALIRNLCEKGNMIRNQKGIASRQPLLSATISHPPLSKKLEAIIKNELNIKKVIYTTSTSIPKLKLDTKITPILQAEGEARLLIRNIQNLRKKQSLNLSDKIAIVSPAWPKSFEKQILTKTLAINIKIGKELQISKLSG